MSNARLIITDGTSANTVSLNVDLAGSSLADWLPKSPQPANPIWASSPYQDGKHLVSKTYDNIIDTFTVVISSGQEDTTIHELRKFIKLLERAVSYWKEEYNAHKYWLEVRAPCETNIRYAIVVDYNIPEIDNPFQPPFSSSEESSTDEVQIGIEHTIWTDILTVGDPSDCVKISSGRDEYSGSSFGSFVPVTSDDDAYTLDPATFSDNTDLLSGNLLSQHYQTGIRFKAVTIPAGATITGASIELFPTKYQLTSAMVRIYGEKVINPAAFTSYADLTGRTLTTAYVQFDYPTLTDIPPAPTVSTPDLKTVIQEIINQGGWASGQDLSILIRYYSAPPSGNKEFGDTDNATYSEPILRVSWYTGANVVPHGEPTPTCDIGPAIVPYWNGRSLTHAFWYDASGGWSVNLVDVGLANNDLLPAVPAVGDKLYVGILDVGAGLYATPFTNLVFNLQTVSVDITAITTSISDGAGGWIAQPVLYNYGYGNPLLPTARVGLNFMTWVLQAGWGVNTVNGIAGLWFCFEVTGVGGSPAAPVKEVTSPIYSVVWPNIHISDDEIHGDIPGIINFLLYGAEGDPVNSRYANMARTMISAKKVSSCNNDQFVPYIALSRYQLAPDATVIPYFGFSTEVQTSESYAGWELNWQEVGASVATEYMAEIKLDLKTYAGRYRVFLRTRINTGAANTIAFFLRIYGNIVEFYDTPWTWNEIGAGWCTFDLGLVAFPVEPTLENNAATVSVWLTGDCTAAMNIDLFDLVFMPVDDTCMEMVKVTGSTGMMFPEKIVTSNFKQGPYGLVTWNYYAHDTMIATWDDPLYQLVKVTILGSFNLNPDEEYYLYFFTYDNLANPAPLENPFQYLIFPVLDKSQRYLLARGDE